MSGTAQNYDVVIVGAGVVGMTVAQEVLKRDPKLRIAVLEKESAPGMHASGRNSGIMHCGIFYGADTVKAKVCAAGAQRMIAFAKEQGIDHHVGGKVILASDDNQLPTVERLMRNAHDNGIPVERINHQQLRELEPYAAEGAAAIYCPTTAIINGGAVLARLKEMLTEKGVTFLLNCQVTGLDAPGQLRTTQGPIHYGFLYNCAGAYADTIAKHYGLGEDYALVPFKGIYWKLSPAANPRVRANIYPVPDVSLPFLGIHLSRVISGDVYLGPTAIPVLGRENYHGLKGIKLGETLAIARQLTSMYRHNEQNFRKLAHLEMGKYVKSNFLKAAKKLMPSLTAEDMVPTPKAGIRPQLVNTKTRKLEMDYIFARDETSLHVLNAISPAFTSGFAFAELIVDTAQQKAA